MKRQTAGRNCARFIVVCFVTMLFVLVLLNVAVFAADNGKHSPTKPIASWFYAVALLEGYFLALKTRNCPCLS